MKTRRIAFRSLANGKIVCADAGGDSPLIANRDGIGPWETFELIELDEGNGYPAPGPQPAPIDPPSVPVQPPRPAPAPSPPGPSGSGGLVLSASDTSVRPRLTRAQMDAFLPDRGEFRFPAPWNTQGVRITNASDGTVRPIGMSYWPNINNHAGQEAMLVLLSLNDTLTIFAVWKDSLLVRRLGTLPFASTGEGCYWSLRDPDLLYVPSGSRLIRYHVQSTAQETVFEATAPIWQCHSSADGRAHSFTLEGGAAVYRDGHFSRWSPYGSYDECQIDKSGRWLCIKEDAYNRIIDLPSGQEWTIRNQDGAVGHSDMGFGYMIGEDDYADQPGAFRLWHFGNNGPIKGSVAYFMHGWDAMTRYVSHSNAQDSRPENQDALFCSAHRNDLPRANEIVLASLSGDRCMAICPNLTDMDAAPSDPYWRLPRANLDPTGQWAVWTANAGGDRMDAYMVLLPRF